MNKIKVGDTIQYSSFEGIRAARVERIDLCREVHDKYGDAVDAVSLPQLHRSCLSLNNGHWCYGEQLIIDGVSAEELPYETDYDYFT